MLYAGNYIIINVNYTAMQSVACCHEKAFLLI